MQRSQVPLYGRRDDQALPTYAELGLGMNFSDMICRTASFKVEGGPDGLADLRTRKRFFQDRVAGVLVEFRCDHLPIIARYEDDGQIGPVLSRVSGQIDARYATRHDQVRHHERDAVPFSFPYSASLFLFGRLQHPPAAIQSLSFTLSGMLACDISIDRWFRAFVEDVDVLGVGEDAVAALAGEFADDVQVHQMP